MKALGTGSGMRFPGGQGFLRIVTPRSWWNVAPPGRGLWKLQLVSQTPPHVPFVFADLAWDPLAVINHSHEYEYGWSPSVLLRIPEPGVALGTPGSALHHLVQAPLGPHHPSCCPHDCLLTHQHLRFPLSGAPPTRNPVACFLTLFKALFQYHPSGTQCWTTQCETAPAPSFSVPSSCFIVLVNTYHPIRLYLLVSRLAVLRQWPSPG